MALLRHGPVVEVTGGARRPPAGPVRALVPEPGVDVSAMDGVGASRSN
uniref:Uncharacterized protein n=1 Tax=Nonomuraea gerenzanensis TaxID=93944 RepID=A0A1M4E421_9ACTN|nr:hypothetical protein BN4615_P3093 [Nonomuraea gerenzanensis]